MTRRRKGATVGPTTYTTDREATMAEFVLEAPSDEPLWEVGDVTLTLPGTKLERVPVKSHANPIRETDDFNPDARPVSYILESLVLQLEDDHQAAARKALIKAVDGGKVQVKSLSAALRWIGEQREEAEERAISRRTARPTSGQQHSTP